MTETDFMLPRDKANHAIYGGAFFILLLFAGHWLAWLTPGWALAGVGLLGSAKEVLWDYCGNRWLKAHGRPATRDASWLDFIATFCGGVAAYLATALD